MYMYMLNVDRWDGSGRVPWMWSMLLWFQLVSIGFDRLVGFNRF